MHQNERCCLKANYREETKQLDQSVQIFVQPRLPSRIEEHEIFNMPSKTILQKTAKSLLSRLFPTKDIEILDQVERGKGRKEAEEQLSLQEELEGAIEHSAKKQRHNSNDEFKAISKEMMVFEATSKRTCKS